MNIDKKCLSYLMTSKEYKESWDATLYKVGDKMFALMGHDKNKISILSLKLDPEFSNFFKDSYEFIIPGYHLNKIHWVSIYLDKVPEDVVFELIDHAYYLVRSKISKNKLKEYEF